MHGALPAALGRSLERLRARGDPLSPSELAERLLCLAGPLDPGLARRIVAALLGQPPSALPERLAAHQLRPAHEAAVAARPLRRATFAVVDLETTGVAPGRSAIVEIGAVRVSRLQSASRFHTLVRPPHALPRRIRDLTGIDDALLAGAPAPGPALRRFRRWLARTPTAPFVAHNAGFDSGFVSIGLRDAGLPAYDGPVLCTRRIARRLLPRLGRYDLDHLCAHFGIRNLARHRALGDAEATARAWIELLRLASEDGARTLGDLLDLQSRPTRRRRRRSRRSRVRAAPPRPR